MGDDTAHWEASGHVSPQGGSQADGTATSEREGQWVGASPSGGSDEGVEVAVCRDLHLLPLNTVTQFIATRTIMDLFLAADRRLGSQVANRWW